MAIDNTIKLHFFTPTELEQLITRALALVKEEYPKYRFTQWAGAEQRVIKAVMGELVKPPIKITVYLERES